MQPLRELMGSQPHSKQPTFVFGPFELQIATGELRKNGSRLKISGQPVAILQLLLESAGELVTRESIRERLWSENTFVDFDHSLNTAIKRLRQALGDDVDHPAFIETIPRKGYRFIGQIDLPKQSPSPELLVIPPPVVGTSAQDFVAGDDTQISSPQRTFPTLLVFLILSSVLLIVGAGFFLSRGRLNSGNSSNQQRSERRLLELQGLTENPITSLPGRVLSPTYSPDGSQIAFGWDGGKSAADFDLYVQAIGTLEPRRLTFTPTQALSGASWSPEGRTIAFMRLGTSNTGIYLIPSTGGTERKVASIGNVYWFGNNLSWSPDGKFLAYIDHDSQSVNAASLQVYILEMGTLKSTKIEESCSSAGVPAFSADGVSLAWICSNLKESRFSVFLYNMKTGVTSELVNRRDGISGIAWSHISDRLLYSSGSGEIFEVSLSDKLPIKLPIGHDATDLASSAKENQIAYVKGVQITNIWKLDLSGKVPRTERVITSSRRQIAPELSPDGSHIVYESTRSGPDEIWICKSDGSENLQLSSFGIAMTGTPRWSPDSQHIVFDSRVEGHPELYVVDRTGGNPRKLVTNIHANSLPSWSADSKWIYFTYENEGELSVWKAPAQGGAALKIAGAPATYPLESPDGRYVYFYRNRRIWRADTDGANPEQVQGMPELSYLEDEWVIADTGIYFLWHEKGKIEIRFFDLKTKHIRDVYSLGQDDLGWIGSLGISRDGKTLYYPHVDQQTSDLISINGWK